MLDPAVLLTGSGQRGVNCKSYGKELRDGPDRMVDILTGKRVPFCNELCSEAYHG